MSKSTLKAMAKKGMQRAKKKLQVFPLISLQLTFSYYWFTTPCSAPCSCVVVAMWVETGVIFVEPPVERTVSGSVLTLPNPTPNLLKPAAGCSSALDLTLKILYCRYHRTNVHRHNLYQEKHCYLGGEFPDKRSFFCVILRYIKHLKMFTITYQIYTFCVQLHWSKTVYNKGKCQTYWNIDFGFTCTLLQVKHYHCLLLCRLLIDRWHRLVGGL